jgi:L-asparaginase/beta-aspartyl-peptidase (threonine type)
MRSRDRGPAVVTHGGAGNVPDVKDGCVHAVEVALQEKSALEMAVAAVVVLEDDPRMNAGTGAVLRLDGTAQLDASVMDGHGFGSVAVVEGIKNPVKLARAVYGSPHMMVAGGGAIALAARLGLEKSDPITPRQREKHEERMRNLPAEPTFQRLYGGVDPRFYRAQVGDTVGAVVRAADGSFAAASSTGGIWCAIAGRVGDTPIPGAGLWVGPFGAVAATGSGELIWREMCSLRVHDAIARGLSAQAACDEVLALFRAKHAGVDCGLIAVDSTSTGAAATTQMPWAST